MSVCGETFIFIGEEKESLSLHFTSLGYFQFTWNGIRKDDTPTATTMMKKPPTRRTRFPSDHYIIINQLSSVYDSVFNVAIS